MDNEIIIVSGLPRSGTSLMMQMLDNGGVPVVTDHIRTADTDNPRGYYEYRAGQEDQGGRILAAGNARQGVQDGLPASLRASRRASDTASSSWSATWTRCSSPRRRCSRG